MKVDMDNNVDKIMLAGGIKQNEIILMVKIRQKPVQKVTEE